MVGVGVIRRVNYVCHVGLQPMTDDCKPLCIVCVESLISVRPPSSYAIGRHALKTIVCIEYLAAITPVRALSAAPPGQTLGSRAAAGRSLGSSYAPHSATPITAGDAQAGGVSVGPRPVSRGRTTRSCMEKPGLASNAACCGCPDTIGRIYNLISAPADSSPAVWTEEGGGAVAK